MKPLLRILAVLACIVGAIWVGQGAGVVPGSVMTGRREWIAYGALLLVAGLVAAWWLRRGARK